MMAMYFDTSVKMTDVLFKNWNTQSAEEVVLASSVTLVLTILFEAMKVLQSVLGMVRKQNPLAAVHSTYTSTCPSISDATHSEADLLSSLKIPTSITLIRKRKRMLFTLESVINLLKFVYGYILMLLVMTFSVWFILPVVLGSGIGYFIFHPIGRHLTEKYSPQPGTSPGRCPRHTPRHAPRHASLSSDLDAQATINPEERSLLIHQSANYSSMNRYEV